MLSFFLSPILAFFSPRLYRETARSGFVRGFAYLFYLTALFCVLILFLCQSRFIPVTSSFVDWLIQATPEMTLTKDGLSANVQQPYLVEHPAFGPLYVIDTTKTSEELVASDSPAILLIGKEKVIVRNKQRHETRMIDLSEIMAQNAKTNTPIQITKNLMKQIAARLMGLIIPIAVILAAPFYFIWKLIAVLFYFLIALLFNLLRKERLKAGSLFSLACYAISPVAVIQFLTFAVPNFNVNLNFFFAFVLTVLYLVYGMFVAVRASAPSTSK